jgi:hypothetical protein
VPDANPNDDTFGIFVLDGVRFAVRRVKEEPSMPHARLVCTHLHSPLNVFIGRRKKSNSRPAGRQRNPAQST